MTRVVKIGGRAVETPERLAADVAHFAANGDPPVVVHGGSVAIDETLAALGIDPEYVETPGGVVSRFTDRETMRAVTMATARVNTRFVTAFRNAGVDAVGLSGVDGGLVTGERKSAVKVHEDGRTRIRRGDHAGTVEAVDDGLLRTLLADGRVPVVTLPVFARGTAADRPARGANGAGGTDGGSDETGAGETRTTGGTKTASDTGRDRASADATSGGTDAASDRTTTTDETGVAVNADADRIAAAVAGAVGDRLYLLTDTAGVYADPDDPSTLIERVATPADWTRASEAAEGFMYRKLMAAERALQDGCEAVVIGDATLRDPVVAADAGHGTLITPDALEVES